MAHSQLKYPIGLLSENIQESIIGGLLAEEQSKHLLFPCNVNSLQL
jgi:hypothetical protein